MRYSNVLEMGISLICACSAPSYEIMLIASQIIFGLMHHKWYVHVLRSEDIFLI